MLLLAANGVNSLRLRAQLIEWGRERGACILFRCSDQEVFHMNPSLPIIRSCAALSLFTLSLLNALNAKAAVATPKGANSFVVTVASLSDWTVDGQPDPTLTFTRGQTYTFDLQGVASFHPFFIKTINSNGTANQFATGITGQGASGETDVVFVVPANAPAQLFYNCGTHLAMAGIINIIDPPPEVPLFVNGFED
jgi:hypothetical protein